MNRCWCFLPLVVLAGCTPKGETAKSTLPSSLQFRDVAEEAGLHFVWKPEGKPPLNILQTIGNGCAFLDYNNDGNLDILLVGPKPALFTGDGKGKFTDSTALLGGIAGHFLGVAVGDYDGDGFPDLYLSGYHEGRLLHNDGGKGFKDVTASSGLKPQPWGTSCGFADLDNDGHLDLYVGNYAEFGPTTKPQLCRFKTKAGDVMSSCGPIYYKGLPGTLSQGDGKGGFRDVTKAWGLTNQTGRTLGVAFADIDGSGRVSLALANDEAPGDLFVNQGPGKLRNQGEAVGVAYDNDGSKHGGMGADFGDYDNDGQPDLIVATFAREVKNLYKNSGGMFRDEAPGLGLAQPMTPYVAFGIKLFDADNDGFLDLIVANGHVQDNIDKIEATTYRQPVQLFHSQGGTHFADESATGLKGVAPIVGRGLAVGDYDNDGKLDVLVVDMDGKPLLLHNETPTTTSWIGFALPPSAWGAQVTVESGGKKWVRQCQPCGSYLSSSDPRVQLGLGGLVGSVTLTVKWPSGKTESHSNVAPGQYWKLVPGAPPQKSP